MAEISLIGDTDGHILASRHEDIGVLTFNRPEKHNAMSTEMWDSLGEAMDLFEGDPSIRVVILKGAGGKSFVSGSDIRQFEDNRSNAATFAQHKEAHDARRRKLFRFSKPRIASIKGWCLGGGLTIALAADLRIAAKGSRLGIPAGRLGIPYGLLETRALLNVVGATHARMLLYTARNIDAQEAARIGLVNAVVEDNALEESTLQLARDIARNAPMAIAASKFVVDQLQKDPEARDLEQVRRQSAACLDSADYAEGRRAFAEKRSPRFTGT